MPGVAKKQKQKLTPPPLLYINKDILGLVVWALIPALGRVRQKNLEFEASLDYRTS